jgi:penicillin-binding protein 1A
VDDQLEPDALRLVHARRQRRRHGLRRGIMWVLCVLGLVVVLMAGIGVGALAVFLHDPTVVGGCDLDHTRPRLLGQNSVMYARDGSRLGLVPSPWNRRPIPLSRMGKWLPEATVAIEDRRYWRRDGAIDSEAILRAFSANVRAGRTVQGGSTIQQQLARDRYLRDHRPELVRKLKEACLAIQLDHRMSKRQIVETYLNGAFYGNHAYGAEAAAQTYFSRPPRRLSLVQAAVIAGLPQAPSLVDPVRHPSAAVRRRNEVLAALRKSHAISPARFRAASHHPLRLRPTRLYRRIEHGAFFETARRELVHRFGVRDSRRGGLRVRTTLDSRMQGFADLALRRWLQLPSDPAGALVAIDPASGAVRAMAVRTPDARNLRFNLATQSRRQAGSTFKVFTLTAAMEAGIPLSSVWNGPSSLGIPDRRCETDGRPWVVHNYADEAEGTMSLLQATAFSVNTIFAQVSLKVGVTHVVDTARRMGVRSPLVPVCSITLGPEGVSPLDMTTAFATLAARGVHHRPQVLQRVTAADGRTQARLHRNGRRVLTRSVTDRVTSALEGVVRSGTGAAANIGRPAAGKTGTAEGFKDAWFCGFVPQLATCVWIGHSRAEIPMANVAGFGEVVGGSVPARIWHDFMAPALADRPVRPLPTPPAAVGRP